MFAPKRVVTLVAVGGLLSIALLEAAPAQSAAKPAAKDSKNATAVAKDINTNIAVGDVVFKSEKEPKVVGYINVPEVMQSTKRGAQVSNDLEKKRQALTETIKKEEQKITQFVTELKSKEATMSTAARSAEEIKMNKMRNSYETLVKESEAELKIAMQQASEELMTELEKTAAEFAYNNGYDVLVDVYSGRTIYAANDALITSDLKNAMDKKYEASTKKSVA